MMNIIDTHVHVWDLDNYRLPWLDGEGPTLKRIRPRAKGSASPIRKRTCHITIIVAPREEA